MYFILFCFASALFIEAIGSYISIVGLSALFSSNPVIIALALSLDFGKLVAVSFLYKNWKKINIVMKSYMLVAAGILMIITSAGAAGYLSAEFQGAIANTKESDIRVSALKEEKIKLEQRKKEIDQQIANLPANSVRGRSKLINEFKEELSRTNERIVEIDKTLPEIEVAKIHADSHTGPILYVAKAFDTTVENAVKYVILLIIFVFDPLAVVLIIAGNFLIDQHKREKHEQEKEARKREEEERRRGYQIEMDEIRHQHELEEEKIEIEKLHTSAPDHVLATADDNKEIHSPSDSVNNAIDATSTTKATLEPESDLNLEMSSASADDLELPKKQRRTKKSTSVASKKKRGGNRNVEPEPSINTDEALDILIASSTPDVIKDEDAISEIPDAKTFDGINGEKADVDLNAWSASEPHPALKIYRTNFTQ